MNTNGNSALLTIVESESGQTLTNCYQCQKCSAGCPVTPFTDYTVSQIIRLTQMNQASKVLSSSMIWLCTACGTCGARCPNDINMALAMDVLKKRAVETNGTKIDQNRINTFHSAFLDNIRKKGRLHEMGMMIGYKRKMGELFADISGDMKLASSMRKKGKLKLIGKKIKGVRKIKKLFKLFF
ncbi:heterodisulfide reductase [Candidatus Poribacteria bacterium]|nr:heterodisulfide reductase [Candidatus Poribacteria bacterium]